MNGLTEPFALSQQMISKHIAYLVRARIVIKTKRGRESVCTLRPEAIKTVSDWAAYYRRFWEESFDKLGRRRRSEVELPRVSVAASRVPCCLTAVTSPHSTVFGAPLSSASCHRVAQAVDSPGFNCHFSHVGRVLKRSVKEAKADFDRAVSAPKIIEPHAGSLHQARVAEHLAMIELEEHRKEHGCGTRKI